MGTTRFSTGLRFSWNGEQFEIKRLLADRKVNAENLTTGAIMVLSQVSLVEALFSGDLSFGTDGENTTASVPELSDFPDHLVEIARYRLDAIRPLLALRPNGIPRDVVKSRVEEIQNGSDPSDTEGLEDASSISSLYRWLRVYEEAGGDIRALIPDTSLRGGKGKHRVDPVVDRIINSVIGDLYYRREICSIDDLHHEIALRIVEENQLGTSNHGLSAPSRSTIVRRIKDLDLEHVYRAHHGRRAAEREFTQFGHMSYPSRPLEEIQIDATKIDVVVIDEKDNLPLGRPTLMFAIDLATRYPVGYYIGFEPEGYLPLMETLYHSICPKLHVREHFGTEHNWLAYGIPHMMSVDNSRAFRGNALRDASEALGIVLKHGRPKAPHLRGSIERLFGSLNYLFHATRGTTFSNVLARGDYRSEEFACVSLQDLEKMLVVHLLDIYAQRFHRGLGAIPADCWQEAVDLGFTPRVPTSAEELLVLLGRVAYRTIQHYGIDLNCIRYNSPDLIPLRTNLGREQGRGKRSRVKIKYHPGDLSRIHVFDPFERQYIEVPALDQEYTAGLSLWKHAVIKRYAKETEAQVDLAALGRAKRKLREIVEEGKSRRRISTRSRIARYERAGQTPSLRGMSQNPLPSEQIVDDDALPTTPRRDPGELSEPLDEPVDEGWSIEEPKSEDSSRARRAPPGGSNA